MKKAKGPSRRRGKLTAAVLAEAVGVQAARVLIERFAGHRLPTRLDKLDRDVSIVAEIDDGATYAEVAERYGLSRPAVIKIASAFGSLA